MITVLYKHAYVLEKFIEDSDSKVSECESIDQLEFDMTKFIEFENIYDIWTTFFQDDSIQTKIIRSLYHSLKLSLNQMKMILEKSNASIDQIKLENSKERLNDKMKLMREKKKSNKFQKEYCNIKKLNNIYKSKIFDLKNQLKSTRQYLSDIFKGNQEELSLIKAIDDEKTAGPPILSEFLLGELIDQMKLAPHARRYSDTIKNVAFIIFSYSPAAYRKLSEFFPFPSEKTVRDSFKKQIKETKENLLNLSQLEVILNKLHKLYTDNDDEEIVAILSADIATMNPRNTGKSGFIAYEIQPSNPQYKSQIVRVKLTDSSHFKKEDLDEAREIIEKGNKAKFDIKMLATDADSKTNKLHTDFFNYLEEYSGTFEQKIEAMKYYGKEFPISDLLHLLKAMRRKFITNYIRMTCYCTIIDIRKEIELLRTSEFYTEEIIKNSSLAQMRDDLALLLYNTHNLHLLGIHEHYQFFSFQFMIVLLLTSIQSSNLTAESRINLCKTVYLSMSLFKKLSQKWQRMKINNENVVNFFDNNNFHRIINNVFCYSFAFKYFGDEINTINLSSHPLELKFGEIRQGSRGNDTAENALYIISKSIIRDELLTNVGKKTSPIRGRCDIAGSKSIDGWNITIPPSISIERIPVELYHICNNWLTKKQFLETNTWKLVCFLNEITPTIIPKLSGENSGTRIVCRLHNLEGKQKQK